MSTDMGVRATSVSGTLEQPTVASWFITLYAMIAVGRWTELIPGAANLPLAKVAIGGALMALLLERRKWDTTPLRQLPLARIAAALYALAVTSVLFSIWKSYSLTIVVNELLTVFASFMIAVKALPNWASIKRLLRGLVYSAGILAATGLIAFVGGRFEVSESYDPNDLAYVLVAVTPLAIGFSRIVEGWRRALWLATAGVLVVATLLTQSRGGLVALIVVAIALLMRPMPARRAASATDKGRRLLKRAIPVLVIAAISWSFLPDDAKQRFSSLTSLSSDYNVDMTNETGRLSLWKRGIIAGLKRPVGYGIGTFETVDGSVGGRYKAAHNSFLLVFVELGVLGLVLFTLMYVRAMRILRAVEPTLNPEHSELTLFYEQKVLSHALKMLLVATAVAGFFLSQTYANVLWLSFAAIAALAATRITETRPPMRKSGVRAGVFRQ